MKTISREEVFLEHITKLIRNLLIDNPNYKGNYYSKMYWLDIIKDTKERANYILEK
jgi:hypothetical protein